MRLDLPYPHKALWPNGRPHWAAKARETKKHRAWAWGAAKADNGFEVGAGPIPVTITCHPKAKGPAPDRDNVSAAAKAYLDGIAEAIGVNDRQFAAPVVKISDARNARFIVEIGL